MSTPLYTAEQIRQMTEMADRAAKVAQDMIDSNARFSEEDYLREADTEVGRIAVGDEHQGGIVTEIVDCDSHVEVGLDRLVDGVNGFVYRKADKADKADMTVTVAVTGEIVRVEEMSTPRLGFDHPYPEGAAREVATLIIRAAQVVAAGGTVQVTGIDGKVTTVGPR